MPPYGTNFPAHRQSSPTSVSGVIVLSSGTRILHMNPQAVALTALLGGTAPSEPVTCTDALPTLVGEFCREVLQHLETCGDGEDWTQFELRRLLHCSTPPMFLRGFGVPGSTDCSPRIVVMLQPISMQVGADS